MGWEPLHYMQLSSTYLLEMWQVYGLPLFYAEKKTFGSAGILAPQNHATTKICTRGSLPSFDIPSPPRLIIYLYRDLLSSKNLCDINVTDKLNFSILVSKWQQASLHCID